MGPGRESRLSSGYTLLCAPAQCFGRGSVSLLANIMSWLIGSIAASYDKDNELKPVETGDGGLEELIDEFNSSKIQYAFVRVIEPISGLPKVVLIAWCGEGVPVQRKGLFNSHVNDFQRRFRVCVYPHCHAPDKTSPSLPTSLLGFFTGYHVAINARHEEDVTVSAVMKKVKDSSGAGWVLDRHLL